MTRFFIFPPISFPPSMRKKRFRYVKIQREGDKLGDLNWFRQKLAETFNCRGGSSIYFSSLNFSTNILSIKKVQLERKKNNQNSRDTGSTDKRIKISQTIYSKINKNSRNHGFSRREGTIEGEISESATPSRREGGIFKM